MKEMINFLPTGSLKLSFRKKMSGKTYLAKQFYDLPLQVLPPYYPDEDGTAFLYLLNPTGGVLQGDRLLTEVTVERDASAVIATPSANKLYKMETDHAEIVNGFQVEAGGVLEFVPDYNIPYARSKVFQSNIFHLHEDATLFAWDMVIPGRTERGEYFDYDLYDSKIKIHVNQQLEAYEYSRLSPAEGSLAGVGILEGHDIYTSVFIYRKHLPEAMKEAIAGTWSSVPGVSGGITYVTDSLACVKLLGSHVFETWEVMTEIWKVFRKSLLGKGSARIRKY